MLEQRRCPLRPAFATLAVVLFTSGAQGAAAAATVTATVVRDVSATPVADAARAGEVEAVRQLLRAGADANAAHGDGMSALHWAARQGNGALVSMLTVAGADVRAVTRLGGYTPLLLAAGVGSAEAVLAFLDAGAGANVAADNGAAPLMLAARSGSVPAVEALLGAGAEVDAREATKGQTALMFAADAGRAAVITTLLAAGADPELETNVFDAETWSKKDRMERMKKFAELAKRNEEAKKKAAEAERKAAAEAAAASGEEAPAAAESKRSRRARERAERSQQTPTVAAGGNDPSQDDRLQSDGEEKKRWWQRKKKAEEEGPRPASYGELVGATGGLTALHYAARQGHRAAALALLQGGARVNHASGGDRTSPLLIAVINGRFDLAMDLLERGGDTCLASDANATPLYAALNVHWAPHSFYPQPSPAQEQTTYLDLMRELLERGADPNPRLERKIWYTGYNFDQSGADETGATPFWRAAQAADVAAMKLLLAHGADPHLPSLVVPERTLPNGRNFDAKFFAEAPQIGDPAITPFQVASGAGYNANFHRIAPGGFLPALRFFVEEIGVDVNAPDSKGYTPLHNAAARGDDQAIWYLLLKGADVTAVSRVGETVADMANGPVQRIQPFPKTLAFLEKMGSQNNDNCVSC